MTIEYLEQARLDAAHDEDDVREQVAHMLRDIEAGDDEVACRNGTTRSLA